MVRRNKRLFLTALIVIAAISCRKPYNPPAIASPGSYLVVEGVINTAGVTNITLSKTVNLSSASVVNPVTGASITIQSSLGASYNLTEMTPGSYQSTSLTLQSNQNYRLSIKTSDGQQYYSQYEAAAVSPPIDSIGYNINGSGLQIYVNTHDPTNQTKYYRWDYNETWKFHSLYQTSFVTNGQAIVTRTPAQDIYYCFGSDTSDYIALASTAHLSQAVVYQNALTAIASTSEKIESEYSIQVNQYALTGDAYAYWASLKEDTEDLGSIFEPQPSNFSGNIYNATNPAAAVIGDISVCAVQTKRIFISNTQLPSSWTTAYPYACQLDTEWYSDPYANGANDVNLNLVPLGSPLIPCFYFYLKHDSPGPPSLAPLGLLASGIECVDCTIRGTTTAPSFWPK